MLYIEKILFCICAVLSSIACSMDEPAPAEKDRLRPVLDEKVFLTILLLEDAQKEKFITSVSNHKEWWYYDELFAQDVLIRSACYDRAGTKIALGLHGGIRICDAQTKEMGELVCCDETINLMCYHPLQEQLATVTDDEEVRIFDGKGEEILSLSPDYHIISIGYHPSGTHLIAGSWDQKVRMFDIEKKKLTGMLTYNSAVSALCHHPTQNQLALGSWDKKVRIIDLTTGKKIVSLHYEQCITALCYDSVGDHLAIGLCGIKLYIFNTRTHRHVASLLHTDDIYSVSYHLSGKQLVTVSFDNFNNKVRIFKKYDEYTLEQIVLKKMMTTWLLIEKPDKKINSSALLVKDVALKNNITHDEMMRVWMSLPEHLRSDMWQTLWYSIEKYGKEISATPTPKRAKRSLISKFTHKKKKEDKKF